MFVLVDTGSSVRVVLAIVLSTAVSIVLHSVETTFFSEFFHANVWYTALSVADQVSAVIGRFVPLVAVARSEWLVAGFPALVACISGLTAYLVIDVRGQAEGQD